MGASNSTDLYNQGAAFLKKNDYENAFACFLQAAEDGHAGACNEVGNFYEHAKGVDQNIQKAVEYYYKSALGGNYFGQFNIGRMYYQMEDYAQSYEWFLKAAEQGLGIAEYNVAFFNYKGITVPKNIDAAVRWATKASGHGYADADKLLEEINSVTSSSGSSSASYSSSSRESHPGKVLITALFFALCALGLHYLTKDMNVDPQTEYTWWRGIVDGATFVPKQILEAFDIEWGSSADYLQAKNATLNYKLLWLTNAVVGVALYIYILQSIILLIFRRRSIAFKGFVSGVTFILLGFVILFILNDYFANTSAVMHLWWKGIFDAYAFIPGTILTWCGVDYYNVYKAASAPLSYNILWWTTVVLSGITYISTFINLFVMIFKRR